MASPVSSLQVIIGADADKLVAEFGRADKALGKTESRFDQVTKVAAGVATVAAAAGVAIAAMTAAATNNADQMGKMAQGAGLATREFTELVYAAKLSDITAEQLSTSLTRLNRNISDTAAGTGEAREAFAALGIQVKTADGNLKNADQIIAEVADQFVGMEDGAGKSALAVMLFGRAGAAMIPMLNAGSEGIKQLRAESVALGVAIDTQTAKAAENFNDQLTRLGQVQQGLANRLMVELLPAMNQVADALVAGAKEGGGMEVQIKALAGALQGGALVAFQTLAVVGSDVAFVFKGIARDLAGMTAQSQALATLDFKTFSALGEMMRADAELARKELDEFQRRVMSIQLSGPGAIGATNAGGLDGSAGDSRRSAPGIAAAGAGEKASKAQTLLGQQLQEGLDEEMKLRAEIAQIVTDFREKERLAEQETYDARNKALIDFYDRQQEEAIKAGEEELRIDDELKKKLAAQGYKYHKLDMESTRSFLGGMAQLMNTNSKTMFEIGKAAAIANTIMNTGEAAMAAYKAMAGIPVVGPALGIAAAAAAIAAGAAQVSNIRAQTLGGGGGATGVFPASPVTGLPAGTPGGNVGGPAAGNTLDSRTLTVQGLNGGALLSAIGVRTLAEELLEYQRNGGRVVFAS